MVNQLFLECLQETLRLTDNQSKVLKYLESHRYHHLQEVATACDLSLGGVKKIVTKLQEAERITRGGTKKFPEWIVK